MSTRPRGLVLAGVAAVAALTLSGCGGTSAARPGTAIDIGDQVLSTSDIDELSVAYCDGLEAQLKSAGQAFPMGFVRAYVVRNLTVRAAAEQLADDYDVTLPPSYDEAMRALEDQLVGFRQDRVEQVLQVESVGPYLEAVETEVGGALLAEEGVTGADDAAKLARGADALQVWMSEHPADINPRYGIAVSTPDLGDPTFVDTGTSYALSPDAVAAAKAEPDQELTATLPELSTLRLAVTVPPADPLAEFRDDMRRLRAECAWKREQTHASLRRYLVEESWETLEAIDSGDPEHLREELGDLLLQIGFHAVIAEEAGEFTFDEVVQGIVDKLRRRNPHVFGSVPVTDAASVNELWESVKATEKVRTSVLDGLPPGLPALLLADKVLDRAERAGTPLPVPAGDDIGDRLLALVAEARAAGVDAEHALRDAVRRALP